MRTLHRRFAVLGCLLCTLLLGNAAPAAAQTANSTVDINTLTHLYEAWLQDQSNEWINKRIEDERADIRKLLEADIRTTLGITAEAEPISQTEDILRSQERQQKIVSSIEEQLSEWDVDLDLLQTEEEKVYLDPKTKSGATKVPFATTESHGELLAKRAVIEERIAVLQSLLPIQKDKLRKLSTREWQIQFQGIFSIVAYGLAIFLVVLAERTTRKKLLSRISDANKRYVVTKSYTPFVYICTGMIILSSILTEHPNVVTSLAIIGAGIAVALQDIVKDFMGWIMIVQRNIFIVGNRITIENHTGEVIDIGMLRFKLLEVGTGDPNVIVLEHTGKSVSLPNALVLSSPVVNHNSTSDFVKAEMRIVITFESDRKKAEEIITNILKEETEEFYQAEVRQQAKRTRMYYLSLQPIGMKVYKNIIGSGFEFTLRFSVPIGLQRPVISDLATKIMDAIDAEPSVELAYDTLRIIPTPPGSI